MALASKGFAQLVVVDALDQPVGGSSHLATFGHQLNESTVVLGVPGGARLVSVSVSGDSSSTARVTVNDGVPGMTLTVSPGGLGNASISYGASGYGPTTPFHLDLTGALAFRMKDMSSTASHLYLYAFVGYTTGFASVQFNLASPLSGTDVDFPLSDLSPQEPAHPVDLAHINYLSFGIIQFSGGQTDIGSIQLLRGPLPPSVPESAAVTMVSAGCLGLWALGRCITRGKVFTHR